MTERGVSSRSTGVPGPASGSVPMVAAQVCPLPSPWTLLSVWRPAHRHRQEQRPSQAHCFFADRAKQANLSAAYPYRRPRASSGRQIWDTPSGGRPYEGEEISQADKIELEEQCGKVDQAHRSVFVLCVRKVTLPGVNILCKPVACCPEPSPACHRLQRTMLPVSALPLPVSSPPPPPWPCLCGWSNLPSIPKAYNV